MSSSGAKLLGFGRRITKKLQKKLTKSHPARGLPTAALQVCALVKLYL
jgi:hypothetical protein